MPKFRKKPVEIEAVEFTGKNATDLLTRTWPLNVRHEHGLGQSWLVIPTLEGDHIARPGDWIIKGVKGEFYPCKPDIFAMTYEPVL
jgi:hypothetical protein